MALMRAKKDFGVRLPEGEQKGIKFDAGLVAPTELTWFEEGGPEGEGFDLELDIVFDGTRYVCHELRMRQRDGGPPVTAEAIREIPVKRMIKAALDFTFLRDEGPDQDGVHRSSWIPNRKPPEGIAKQGPTDEVLRWLVQIHELATVVGDPPTKSVQDELGISRATAGRWVAEARRRGWLPPLDEEGGES